MEFLDECESLPFDKNSSKKEKLKVIKRLANHKEFMEAKNYTRELMLKLINRVEIHDDRSVDIYFNFKG